MFDPLTPPGTTENINVDRALVLAPHFDDEVLGCGGLLARLSAQGTEVQVLFLTDGGQPLEALPSGSDYRQRRRDEAERATVELGVAGHHALDIGDGELEEHLESVADAIGKALVEHRPQLLLVPSPLEVSRDHRAAFSAVHEVLAPIRQGDDLYQLAAGLRILAYEINHPLYADLLVDVDEQLPTIERAMACYQSQQEQRDYLAASLGLRRFRGLTLTDVESAEAYRQLELTDFTTRGRATLVRHLGGVAELLMIETGPLVSVIVRTKDRPQLLAEALASIAASRYRRLEVVLVNDGGAPPEVAADFPLPLIRVDLEHNQGRAAAGNAGVTAARGDFIAFLDDDDLVEPEHYATLVGAASAAEVRIVYSDAAVGVYRLGDKGWQCADRRLPYSRDFDPDLLCLDNYIPFHTLLIERSLISRLTTEGSGPFDTELPFFEDWDLLLRLAELVPFHHLPRVTCEYRQFRGAGHHVLGDRPRQRADFLDFKAKVIERYRHRLTAARLATTVDLLRAETISALDEADSQRRQLRAESEARHRTRGELQATLDHQRLLTHQVELTEARLQSSEAHLEGLRAELETNRLQVAAERRHVAELESFQQAQSAELVAAHAEIGRLTELVATMESTRAWRLHQSVQRIKK